MTDQQPEARDGGAPLWTEPLTVTEEAFDTIREHFDSRARDKYTPADVFGYRLIASSDGVDSYFTKTDRATSMENYLRDLTKGQSVLGNHATGTFSYGSSYGGEILKADPDRPEYEETFYARYAGGQDLAAEHWTVGDYYMIRDTTLNGQPTDDLIRAIEMGAVKKASISFTVGRYVCGIDGTAYRDFGWFGLQPNEEEGCTHFPGLEYKMEGGGEKRLAFAIMEDNDLLETSWVYKNASPGAMLLRRADALARSGALDQRQVATIEERFKVRLPTFEPRVFDKGAQISSTEVRQMADKTQGAAPPAEPEATADPQEERGTERLEEPIQLTGDQQVIVSQEERIAALETRQSALDEANDGEEVTPSIVRDLRDRASMGDKLFSIRVEEAVKGKVRARGEKFDAERYRAHLTSSLDLDYVEDEVKTWDEAAAELFKAGRQVDPADPPTTPKNEKKRAGQSNLLGSRKTEA